MRATVATALAVAVGLTGASGALVSTASAAPAQTAAAAPGTAFTAYGVKGTAWRAVVQKGSLKVESRALGTFTTKVRRSAFAKGVEFTGTRKGQAVVLTVRGGACKDASGKNTGQTAKLTVGKRVVTGCAVSGARPIADT